MPVARLQCILCNVLASFKTEVEVLWRFRFFWLLMCLYPLLIFRYISVTGVQFLLFFFLFSFVSILIFFAPSYFSSFGFIWWFFQNFHQEIQLSLLQSLDWSSFGVLWIAFLQTMKLELQSVTYIFSGAPFPVEPRPPHYPGCMITLRHTTVGRTPLDEWSARRRDLYLTTHNTLNRHPCPRRDSNPQSQQANSRRPSSYTARPLGSAGLVMCTDILHVACLPFWK